MAVKIRLKRFGKIRAPFYRVVVADSRTKRDGRVIEEIGKYHPTEEPSLIEIKSDRAQYWLGVGAQPSPQVEALLKLTGDWGIFKGEKNPRNTVQGRAAKELFVVDEKKKAVLNPKVDKAVEETPVAKVEKAKDAGKAPAAEVPAAEVPVAEVPVAEAPVAEAPEPDSADADKA